ncbi:DNA excision repair protein ERCC-2 [Bacillus sp. SORGH_AS 510]|uniref:ATP-dependent DNA helicase n=1 Tax=Bacillus sp. SORGH_AS_0510 TaxID=3041771 RepID=UPI002780A6FD|nr:ATP-dependent DNA helicase [Bacillus sp. SORGH_AS_0510]MDQ1145836.1 DNA excision repair protein ERCC-2 [Bacillus sp. SORGH_AS_0510]
MTNLIQISVRSLVEHVYRSGSIDNRFRSQSSLIDGTRIHQKIQKTYQKGDQKEVYLRSEIHYKDLTFLIDGRCDGLLFQDDKVTIDEIKSTNQPLEQIRNDGYPVHWAQAKMYAYIYMCDHQLSEISVQLTYVHVETLAKKQLKTTCHFADLEAFVLTMFESYAPFAKWLCDHQRKRNKSILDLSFPFETYREGQRKLAGAVYKTIVDEKNLFAKAPTGIGKTISTLFPAVKAIGEEHLTRIFYLTAKTITRTTAEEAFEKMASAGLCMKTVTITAKEKVCFKEETKCQKDYCEFANGYYDRINGAIVDILGNENSLTREVIESYARKHTICPFEFSLDLSYAVDAVICDYNYIFDPRVSLKRLIEDQKKTSVLLIDEAHNLVERGREMFSASINKDIFLQLKKELKGIDNEVSDAASRLNSWFLSQKKKMAKKNEEILQGLDETFTNLLHDFLHKAEVFLLKNDTFNLLEAYFKVNQFMKVIELIDDHYLIFAEKNRNDLSIKLFCIDPSKVLSHMGKGFRAKVFFSATLSPLPYYKEVLGGNGEDYNLTIPSPFSKEQLDIFIKPLSTRYRDRERTKESIVKVLHALVKKSPGNYLCFLPSYEYLRTIYEGFMEVNSETETILQDPGMSEAERESLLAMFQPQSEKTLLGFAVLGGVFSEGVDLIGERLHGVVIVGVGLPQLCLERNLIKEHFNMTKKNGYDYAYVYPGMNKVLQAGGRLIRSEKDQGTIVLIDDRFLESKYQNLLPQDWKEFTII